MSSLREPARRIGTISGDMRRAARRLRRQGYYKAAQDMAAAAEQAYVAQQASKPASKERAKGLAAAGYEEQDEGYKKVEAGLDKLGAKTPSTPIGYTATGPQPEPFRESKTNTTSTANIPTAATTASSTSGPASSSGVTSTATGVITSEEDEEEETAGTTAAARVGGVDGLLEEIDRMGSTAANRAEEKEGEPAATPPASPPAPTKPEPKLKKSETKKGYLLLDRDADTPDADKYELVGMRKGKMVYAPINEVYSVAYGVESPTEVAEKARSKYQTDQQAVLKERAVTDTVREAENRKSQYWTKEYASAHQKAQQEANMRAIRMADAKALKNRTDTERALAQGLVAEQARNRAMQAWQRMAPGPAKQRVGLMEGMSTPEGAAAIEAAAARTAPARPTRRLVRRLVRRRPGQF